MASFRRLTTALLLAVLAPMLGLGLLAPTGCMAAPSSDHSSLGVPANAPIPRYSSEQRLSKGVFLVADPRIRDSRFLETVILLVEYDRTGALGIIINRPTGTRITSLLPDMEAFKDRTDTVRYGGPVSMHQIFILMRSQKTPDMAQRVFANVHYSTSRKLLDQLLSRKEGGDTFLLYAGYAGWAAGQLENEVRRGDWSIAPADAALIFDREPAQIWHELTKRRPSLQVRCCGSSR